MKFLFFFLLTVSISWATPADDATGKDLVNAAKLLLNDPDQPRKNNERFVALYMIGYIDGLINMDGLSHAIKSKETSTIKLPKDYTLVNVLQDLEEFIGESIILTKVPAKDLCGAYIIMQYGETKETRQLGYQMLLELIGKKRKKSTRQRP